MTEPQTSTRISNVSVAAISGAAGCFMTVMIVGALVLGMGIDKLLGFKGPFTIGLVLVSAPVSLYVVVRLVLRVVRRTQAQTTPQDTDSSF